MSEDANEDDRVDFSARVSELQAAHERGAKHRLMSPWEDAGWAEDIGTVDVEARRMQRWSTLCPSRFVHARLEDVSAPEIVEWCANPRGRNLLLLGAVGTGKTHAALAAARERHIAGADVAFVPTVNLLDQLRPGGPDGRIDEVCGVDLLVLDDLGVERLTDWAAERVYLVVNSRWLEERPTIVTTNLAPRALSEAIGERVYSRLQQDAVAVGLAGDDRRRRR